ncbi:MAG: SurA N-terminal domain-containing protein, partial [Ghiorsea sp.]
MLESMRSHAQGWIAKVILGAIILSFALWGVGDYFTGNQIETVAEIDGQAINNVDFAATYQRQLASYSNMLGDQFSKELADQLGVKNETIQTMINRRLMLVEAESLGLVVPDQALLGTVQSTPQFQESNGFSAARYQALTRQMGFQSARDYEAYLRQSIIIDTLQKSISGNANISANEIKERFKAKFEQRILAALVVSPDDLQADIEVSDSQARDWYDAHLSQYQSPLKVSLEVVEINAEMLPTDLEISDADIQASYQSRLEEYSEAEQRKASHILIRVANDAAADVLAIAQEKIQAAKARLDAGEAFADVAKDVSDDVTASEGGSLGFFAKGAMVEAFEDAVFNQLKVGEVSDVVQTQFGLHLIALNEIQATKVTPLADVRDTIKQELLTQTQAEEAYRLSEELDNALGMEDSLKAAAASVNLSVRNLGTLSAERALAEPLLRNSKELNKKAFSAMPGDAIEIVELEQGHYVALEVVQRFNPGDLAFEDVVARVYDDVRAAEAGKKAKSIANEILTAAKAGENIDALAQDFAQPKYISKMVLNSGEGDSATWLSSDVLAAAFRTPNQQWVEAPLMTGQGVAIVFVKEVKDAAEDTFDAEKDNVREEALKAK